MNDPSPHERSLFKVMVFATALSFGIMAAMMVSMRGFFGGTVSFQFGLKTLIGFAGGWLAGWLFWRAVGYFIGRGQ